MSADELLAEAFTLNARAARTVRQLVIMGGAIRVPGNLEDGGVFKSDNVTAGVEHLRRSGGREDHLRFRSSDLALCRWTRRKGVPIDMALLEQIQSRASTPLAQFVAQVLATDRESIREEIYFAWDPLAAVILTSPVVATLRPLAIEISDKVPDVGRTIEVKARRANAQVALDADALRFRDVFMAALGSSAESRSNDAALLHPVTGPLQPKISLTLSNSEESRCAGRFSTGNVAPSCSIRRRCSRVILVGVTTWIFT